ncbi:hypothetical protein BP6252_02906 [Coleophoma cylindrospora]|uniref:N-acetyltransferase domain-containing protein n=1 Tax=Coleophoma cylindrospora TaxID=1849047 RepID=A0A3D8SG90_9HELO|nr:hypothetical protein BP6252_02906 [Coleophoma cylindrospora]
MFLSQVRSSGIFAKAKVPLLSSYRMLSTVAAKIPEPCRLPGRTITVEPLQQQHAHDLSPVLAGAEHAALWKYMFKGPFLLPESFPAYISSIIESTDPLYFAITDNKTERAIGYASLMRIDPSNRAIEVGNIMFSPLLSRSTAGTEAMYLIAKHVFEDLGYRRYEWKCDNLNAPSKRAAERFGFTFEGIFRQHMIVKESNRDTAWFSMLDSEWPLVKRGFENWLDPRNFNQDGSQLQKLEDLRV